jgi:polysaccharide pyruvyl transferase WcaK-like protein
MRENMVNSSDKIGPTSYFIFGYFGWKNVGDDAMLYSILEELFRLDPNASISVLSPCPVTIPSTQQNHVTFVKPKILAVLKGIWNASTFVLGGGTHFSDYGKAVNAFKVNILLLSLIMYAKILRKRVLIISNGFGPLETVSGNVLVKGACKLSDRICVRDQISYKYLVDWRLQHKGRLAFDISVLLDKYDCTENITDPKENILGLSVTPVHEIYHNNKDKDDILIKKLSGPINNWLDKNPNAEVWLFTFHGKSRDDDIWITESLRQSIKPTSRVRIIPYSQDPREVLSNVGKCSAFIGMKYHSCVFAYINQLPLLIIDYHPKCRAFGKEIGLSDTAIISLQEIIEGNFARHFDSFITNPQKYHGDLSLEDAKKRAKLNREDISCAY